MFRPMQRGYPVMLKPLTFQLEPPEEPTWRIFRLRGNNVRAFLGIVCAPDQVSAIKRFGISDPVEQKRLVPERRV